MKLSKIVLTGMPALALALALAFSGCGNPTGGSENTSDTTPPTVVSAVIEDLAKDVLKVTFSERVTGVTASVSSFSVTGTPDNITIIGLPTGSANNTLWSFTLSRDAVYGETITLSYNATSGTVEDAAGNDLGSFTGNAVTNLAAQVGGDSDTTPPQLSTAVIKADEPGELVLTFSESVTGVSATGWSVIGATDISISSVAGSGKIYTFTLSRNAAIGEAITLSYNGTAVEDTSTKTGGANKLAAITNRPVTNQTGKTLTITGISLSGYVTVLLTDVNNGLVFEEEPESVTIGHMPAGGTAAISGGTATITLTTPDFNNQSFTAPPWTGTGSYYVYLWNSAEPNSGPKYIGYSGTGVGTINFSGTATTVAFDKFSPLYTVYAGVWGGDATYGSVSAEFSNAGYTLTSAGAGSNAGYLTGGNATGAFNALKTAIEGGNEELSFDSDWKKALSFESLMAFQDDGVTIPDALKTALTDQHTSNATTPLAGVFGATNNQSQSLVVVFYVTKNN
jgi:hypothetical protein